MCHKTSVLNVLQSSISERFDFFKLVNVLILIGCIKNRIKGVFYLPISLFIHIFYSFFFKLFAKYYFLFNLKSPKFRSYFNTRIIFLPLHSLIPIKLLWYAPLRISSASATAMSPVWPPPRVCYVGVPGVSEAPSEEAVEAFYASLMAEIEEEEQRQQDESQQEAGEPEDEE